MAFVLAAPCRAELLEDGKWWGTPWQKVKQENYTLTINSVGEVLVRGRNRITIGSPQMLFFWKNKSFSFHHDIHGKGPWKKVEGKREKMNGIQDEMLFKYATGLIEEGMIADYYIFGHRHLPVKEKLNENSSLVILGDWLVNFTYAEFDGEAVSIKYF